MSSPSSHNRGRAQPPLLSRLLHRYGRHRAHGASPGRESVRSRNRSHGRIPDSVLVEMPLGPATWLTIRVKAPEEEHSVTVGKVLSWLDGGARSPAELVKKNRLKERLRRGARVELDSSLPLVEAHCAAGLTALHVQRFFPGLRRDELASAVTRVCAVIRDAFTQLFETLSRFFWHRGGFTKFARRGARTPHMRRRGLPLPTNESWALQQTPRGYPAAVVRGEYYFRPNW